MRTGSQVALVVDRSRDGIRSGALVSLHMDPRFRVTENERRLSSRTLQRCDVLVIQTGGVSGYRAAELAAVRKFVRGGGGLLLQVAAGACELDSGRPVAESAAQQVADIFAVQFISPDDAKGKVTPDTSLARGYRRRDLVLSPSGPLKGFRLDDLSPGRSAPLLLPKGARVLLRHRRTREPVAAALRHGRGRVVVANVSGLGPWETIGASVVSWLAEGRRRKRTARPLPEILPVPVQTLRRKGLLVRSRGVRKERVRKLLTLITDAVAWVNKTFGPMKRQTLEFEIAPGTGCWLHWEWRVERRTIQIGADTCEPSLIYGLATALSQCRLWSDGVGHLMGRTIGENTLSSHLALKALESLGFAPEAARRRAVLEAWPDGKGDPRKIDLGRWRSEAGTSPAMWVWRALEDEFGPKVIERFLKARRKKFPWKKFPHWDVITELDILIYYLSRAARRGLFKWFAAHGATVHPLPLISTKDKAWDRRCVAIIRRRFRDVDQPLSERYDAARVVMRSRIHKKVSLTREVRALASGDEADRLVSAMRLARTRDPRGKSVLLRLARRARDPAHAAIAAVTLAEMGDDRAADRLAELAAVGDPRFQLDAHAALARLGRDIPTPLRVVVRREGQLKCLADIDGYVGANIFSGAALQPWPGGIAVPHYYVHWVHTAPKWRRKGISRILMQRTMSDRWPNRTATAGLDTGTKNVAHTMYRRAGFIDIWTWDDWSRPASGSGRAPVVRGVRLRRAAERDVTRMTALFNQVYADHFNMRRLRPAPLFRSGVAVAAEKKGKLVGYARGSLRDPDDKGKVRARIGEVCVKRGKQAEKITHALLTRFCAEVARRGASEVKSWMVPEDEAIRRGFQAAGFVSKKDEGVEMWRLNNLPLLLEHITPLLERRLGDKKRNDWCGTISFRSETHAAALRVRGGKVRVLKAAPRAADIAIDTDDQTLSRIMCGRETVFEAMLQLRLRITPKANRDVTTLLESLFPRMKLYLA